MTVRDTRLFHSWHRADFRRLNPEVRKVIYAQILRFSWRALRQIGLLTTEGEKLKKTKTKTKTKTKNTKITYVKY